MFSTALTSSDARGAPSRYRCSPRHKRAFFPMNWLTKLSTSILLHIGQLITHVDLQRRDGKAIVSSCRIAPFHWRMAVSIIRPAARMCKRICVHMEKNALGRGAGEPCSLLQGWKGCADTAVHTSRRGDHWSPVLHGTALWQDRSQGAGRASHARPYGGQGLHAAGRKRAVPPTTREGRRACCLQDGSRGLQVKPYLFTLFLFVRPVRKSRDT